MKNISAILISVVMVSPLVAFAQTNDQVILDLLRSLEGPVVAPTVTSSLAATPQSTPTPSAQSVAPSIPAPEVKMPFHLFSLDGNEPRPDPNEVAMKFALESLMAQLAALVAGNTQTAATSTATTTSGTADTIAPIRKPFARNLAQGARGVDVSALQEILIARGFLFGEPTGYFGILTKTAVITFQEENGLEGVGTVGPKTREILNGLPAERFVASPPPQSHGPVSIPLIASSTSVSASTTLSVGTSTSQTSSSTPLFDLWAPPVSVSMSLLPSEAPVGGSVSITWLSQNATGCIASDGWEGPKSTLGAATIQPLEFSLNFVLTCTGPGGVASTSALVVVGGEE